MVILAIYDENTYKATEGFHPKADKEIILPVDNLHADNHGVALAICQIPENCAYLIAVGSGTVHDITLTEEIKNGNIAAYEKLTYGLLMSGLAMQMLGNSRCASGSEHHVSHLIEMQPEGLNINSNALHGEKVGVGTLLVSKQYHNIISDKNIIWKDYEKADSEYIRSIFGAKLSDAILEENSTD